METKMIIFLAFLAFASCSPWQDFKVKFNKTYSSIVEEEHRKAIFMKNLERVKAHNEKFSKGLSTYTQGLNNYSDWTFDEFVMTMSMKSEFIQQRSMNKEKTVDEAPDTADWSNIMGPVRTQGQCGDCWAWAAVGVTEAAWVKAGNDQVDLSVQMIIDCDSGSYGCNGGYTDTALDTIIKAGGDCLEKDYPYTATTGTCKTISNPAAHISRYDTIHTDEEGIEALASSVAQNGPHAIYIANSRDLMQYSGGIFDDPYCPTDRTDHGVILMGYDKNENYWLIRNFWGESWGENGNIRMTMGKNMCNCEYIAFVPFV